MKTKLSLCVVLVGLMLTISNPARGQLLFSEDFDDGQATTRWTAYPGRGIDATFALVAQDTNFDRLPFLPSVDGINDDFSGFSFDYSTVGIPAAPNSTNGSTVGLKMQANLFTGLFGGFSASPNGLSLSGDFSMTFDTWANSVGAFPGGGAGSTIMNTMGILNTGTQSESILSATGVFFGATGDGNSGADYRAYSVEDQNSYDGTAGEPHATYHAAGGSRNSTAQLYIDTFGTGRTVPAAQLALFPGQTGTTVTGSSAFAWHEHEIKKVGNSVTWTVNGKLLITVDLTNFATPTLGSNISFGASDIANSTPGAEGPDLLFALFDNIEVNQVSATDPGDFDEDGDVDGYDFLKWQRGESPNGDPGVSVSAADLEEWQAAYNGGNLTASVVVPEPGSLALLLIATSLLGSTRKTPRVFGS